MKRLISNRVLTYNTFSAVSYLMGLTGYWTFMPKYLETQFRQTASDASLVTGNNFTDDLIYTHSERKYNSSTWSEKGCGSRMKENCSEKSLKKQQFILFCDNLQSISIMYNLVKR